MTDLQLKSAAEYSISELTALFNAGFEGYFVPIDVNEAFFSFLCAAGLVDFSRSLVAEFEGVPAGILLLGSRGWTLRGAAMGIVTEHRNEGIGTGLMQRAVADCREAGFRHFILEVFEENVPAIRVYEKCGFRTKRRLIGYERAVKPLPGTVDFPTEIDPYEVALKVAAHGEMDMPWMCSPEFYAAFPPNLSKAYALEDKAFSLVMPKSEKLVRLSCLLVSKEHRRQGWGRKMMEGLSALYPDQIWEMTPVFPDGFATDFLLRSGFEIAKLNQLEMEISF